MGYVRLRPRPWPVKQDESKREDFRDKLILLNKEADVEIWYQDECGVLGDSIPRLVWTRKGSRPLAPYTGLHIKDNVIGAVRPSDGKFVSLIMPFTNTQTFQIFLDHMQKHIGGGRVIMILDNASWHKPQKLNWGPIEAFFLPPYSPDLNPIERIWLNLKKSFFTNFVAQNHSDLSERLCDALRYYIDNKEVCKSICFR